MAKNDGAATATVTVCIILILMVTELLWLLLLSVWGFRAWNGEDAAATDCWQR